MDDLTRLRAYVERLTRCLRDPATAAGEVTPEAWARYLATHGWEQVRRRPVINTWERLGVQVFVCARQDWADYRRRSHELAEGIASDEGRHAAEVLAEVLGGAT